MKKNGALDIICKILSVFLSIALVVSLLVTVLFASVNNLLQPETIVKLISEAAGSSVIENNGVSAKSYTLSFTPVVLMGGFFYNNDTGESFTVMPEDKPQAGKSEVTYDENGVVSFQGNSGNIPSTEENFTMGDSTSSTIGGFDMPEEIITEESPIFGEDNVLGIEGVTEEDAKEVITAFLESDVGKEIVGEYTEAVTEVLEGGEGQIDKEEIKEIIIENKEEIFDFVEEYTGQKLDREAISAELDKMLNENLDEFLDGLPQPKELVKDLPVELFTILSIINNKIILKSLITIDIVLAALIFVLRLWEFAGFLWLSVDGIVAGTILGVIFLALNILKGLILTEVGQAGALVNTLMEAILSKILLGLIIIFISVIIFMIVHIILRKTRKKITN